MVAESVLLADTVLIVDDSPGYRRLLATILARWQYRVIEAQDGEQALTCLASHRVHIVISDWEMPLMDGAALCRAIRAGDYGHYIYLILLTIRQSTEDMLAGMAAGADDFLTKPLNQGQLRSRLHAAQRIISLEATLAARNATLAHAYQQIESDLQAAAAMQRNLLPSHDQTINGFHADWLFLPSAYVSGDLLNYVLLDTHHLAFYCVDVAGHGVSAAMLAQSVAQEFNSALLTHSLLFSPSAQAPAPPHQVVGELNRRFCLEPQEDGVMRYFTLVYGVLDTRNGQIALCQAGHPTPLWIRADGSLSGVGDGGLPIGLFEWAAYEDHTLTLAPGDRLCLYSDGVSECDSPQGELFGELRLRRELQAQSHAAAPQLLQTLAAALSRWHSPDEGTPHQRFSDDISLLMITRCADDLQGRVEENI
ncbi:SpoIIE family protein phosphatase [Edwardsiella piscicida]|uniref:PP2C family protein-serine/threonine phosphatase n=1 Tax=Edwardsiella piscicida TaxID=1263550 RepID=UPI00084CDE1F|nr:SpoIIE family protein phosphatase [Edwardsiella piscicida]AOP44814.1 SpoIIE family protein phosphatase [Edwardsiella piscicida]EKS7766383.1 SpoIIE family protein phosphatase [Edwardsiella piscicida]UCQ30522.1 SpoIIE family protein phosphatase [Edwardsiella piscicida]UCQ56847.1 SpoIIE family protein phosphatase [Edwardsiella piscicida]